MTACVRPGVEKILRKLSEAEEGERAPLLDELETALGLHMAVEEKHLYPIVKQVMGEEPVEEAETEHDLARDGLGKLRELEDKSGFGAAVDMLTAGIKHHVQEEEDEIFPKLRSDAADQISELDPEQLENEARAASSSGGAASPPSKAELYEQAKEKDIDGRSSMSKDELRAALARQG